MASPLKPAITRTMLLVSDIRGGGVYALVGEVGDEAGAAIWTALAPAGIVAAFTAASYAELVSKYPHAGVPRCSCTARSACRSSR